MPAVYSAYALRQAYVPPKPKVKEVEAEEPSRARARAEIDARLTVLWSARPKLGGDEIARRLGFRNRGSVYAAVKRLGLPSRSEVDEALPVHQRDRIIRECWSDKSITTLEIAGRCGLRFAQSVTTRARKLGLPRRAKRRGQELVRAA
jgi:hypothetical protein